MVNLGVLMVSEHEALLYLPAAFGRLEMAMACHECHERHGDSLSGFPIFDIFANFDDSAGKFVSLYTRKLDIKKAHSNRERCAHRFLKRIQKLR